MEIEKKENSNINYAMIAIAIGILIMFLFVGVTAYVAGAKVACANSDSYLNEDFRCEEIESENQNPMFTGFLSDSETS